MNSTTNYIYIMCDTLGMRLLISKVFNLST